MKKVSIIIPVYNAEKTIGRCLDALISQTYKNIEVICVNDGSKDNSWNILEEYAQKDARIKVFNNENHGVAYTRHFAISKSDSDYLMFCDADDWYNNNTVETMVKTIEEQNVDIVMCDCNIIDLADGKIQKGDNKVYHYLIFEGKLEIDSENFRNINSVLWNKILKREIIKKYNIEYPTQYEHDDATFVYKYLSMAKTYYGIKDVLYNYVVGNENSIMGQLFTNKNNGREYDFIYFYADYFKFMQDKEDKKDYVLAFKDRMIRTHNHFTSYLPENKKSEAYKLLRNFILSSGYFEDNNIEEIEIIKKAPTPKKFKRIMEEGEISIKERLFSSQVVGDHKILRFLGLNFKIRFKDRQLYPKIFVVYYKPDVLFENNYCVAIHAGRNNIIENKDGKLSDNDKKWMEEHTIGDNTGDNISELNSYINEWTAIYWLWKNYCEIGNPEVIGLIHYRTMFMLDIYPGYYDNYMKNAGYTSPYINYLLKNYKAITGTWVKSNTFDPRKTDIEDLTRSRITNYEAYGNIKCGHNISFYDGLFDLLKKYFPKEYKDFYKWSTTPNHGGPYKNMFITRREDFFKMCEWIFPILFALVEKYKDYDYANADERRNISWLAELLFAYYFDKYVGEKHCRQMYTFRPYVKGNK